MQSFPSWKLQRELPRVLQNVADYKKNSVILLILWAYFFFVSTKKNPTKKHPPKKPTPKKPTPNPKKHQKKPNKITLPHQQIANFAFLHRGTSRGWIDQFKGDSGAFLHIPKRKIQPELLPPKSVDGRKFREAARGGITGDLFNKFSLVLCASKPGEITALPLDEPQGLSGNSSCVEAAPRIRQLVLTWNSSNHSDHPEPLEMWEW